MMVEINLAIITLFVIGILISIIVPYSNHAKNKPYLLLKSAVDHTHYDQNQEKSKKTLREKINFAKYNTILLNFYNPGTLPIEKFQFELLSVDTMKQIHDKFSRTNKPMSDVIMPLKPSTLFRIKVPKSKETIFIKCRVKYENKSKSFRKFASQTFKIELKSDGDEYVYNTHA